MPPRRRRTTLHPSDRMTVARRDVPHVVVVGAGFAGLTAARRLAEQSRREGIEIRITLVDRHNYHTFQPLLYQVATAGLEPQSIGRSLRGIVRRLPVEVRLGTVVDVDLEDRCVVLDDGQRLDHDVLVLAAGATTADYGIDGVADHAFNLKSIPDAMRLRNHVLLRFEHVEAHPELATDGDLTFVVAGGGPTGVELAGALAELVEHAVRVDHPQVDRAGARIVLVEMLDDLLTPYSQQNRDYVRRALEERGVEVRTGTAIESLGPDHVALSDGTSIATTTVVWTAGVRASPLASTLGVPQGKGGRIEVAADLRLPEHPHAFVIGDLAGATDEHGAPLPQLAPVAIQQGRHVADQVLRLQQGSSTRPFRYRDRGTMATIGRRDAVAELGDLVRLRGTPAWLAWLLLHLVTLIGFRNRLTVLLNWTYNYLTYDHAARLVLAADESREDDEVRGPRRTGTR